MDLLPPDALIGVAAVLTYGAEKYGDRNWEKGMTWGRCHAALMRHLMAWAMGEDNDPETGLSHLDHALCCLMFLSAFSKRRIGTDDRNKILSPQPRVQIHPPVSVTNTPRPGEAPDSRLRAAMAAVEKEIGA